MGQVPAYRVKAQLVVAKVSDERHEVYLSQGAFVPAEVDKAEVKRLLELGLIESTAPAGRTGGRSRAARAADPAPDPAKAGEPDDDPEGKSATGAEGESDGETDTGAEGEPDDESDGEPEDELTGESDGETDTGAEGEPDDESDGETATGADGAVEQPTQPTTRKGRR